MKKQIIVVSEITCTLPNVVTFSKEQFLSSSFANAYILIDRTCVSTSDIIAIKKHCQDIGLNPFIDGSHLELNYVFLPDWQAETDVDGYNNPIREAIKILKVAESMRISFEIETLEKKINPNWMIDHPMIKRLFALKSQLQFSTM